jgi:hypothetical protein
MISSISSAANAAYATQKSAGDTLEAKEAVGTGEESPAAVVEISDEARALAEAMTDIRERKSE